MVTPTMSDAQPVRPDCDCEDHIALVASFAVSATAADDVCYILSPDEHLVRQLPLHGIYLDQTHFLSV